MVMGRVGSRGYRDSRRVLATIRGIPRQLGNSA